MNRFQRTPPSRLPTLQHRARETMPSRPTSSLDSVSLSFGNFEFQDQKSVWQRGGGVRELHTLLRKARRQAVVHQNLMKSGEVGVRERQQDLMHTALERASGKKIRDDATRLSKALAKRRNKKRQSAKKWEQRRKALTDSVERVVHDRSVEKQAMRAKREAKKEKRRSDKKGGRGAKTSGGRGGGGGSRGRGGPARHPGKQKDAKKQRGRGGGRGGGGAGGKKRGR